MKLLHLDIEKPCIDHGYIGSIEGYARVRRPTGKDGKVSLHRWLFGQAHGYLPEVVMHVCDNPRCVELSHLVGGSRALNNKDRAMKGRSATNVHSRRRLEEDQVRQIRARFAKRTRYDRINGVLALAREFGIDSTAVYQICSRRTYRDVV